MKKIVLTGYYGHNNFGDDMMLDIIIDKLKDKCEINVITNSKESIKASINKNINFFETFKGNKLRNLCLYLSIFWRKDYFVWGGGTCFSDEDGVISPLILILAKILGLKIYFIGIGVNPIKKTKNILKMKLNSLLIDKVYLRDNESMKNMNVFLKKEKLSISEDIVFLFNNECKKMDSEILTISLRDLKNYINNQELTNFMIVVSDYIKELVDGKKYSKIIILNLDNNIDTENNFRLYKVLREKNYLNNQIEIEFVDIKNYNEKISYILKSKVFICLRLHGIFISKLAGIPTFGISYSPKVGSFMKRIGSNSSVNLYDVISNPLILKRIEENVFKENETINITEFKKNAEKNFADFI